MTDLKIYLYNNLFEMKPGTSIKANRIHFDFMLTWWSRNVSACWDFCQKCAHLLLQRLVWDPWRARGLLGHFEHQIVDELLSWGVTGHRWLTAAHGRSHRRTHLAVHQRHLMDKCTATPSKHALVIKSPHIWWCFITPVSTNNYLSPQR